MLLRERPAAPVGTLPAPAPLPSLTTAFSRRAAIFGAVATSGAMVTFRRRAGVSAQVAPKLAADARLAAVAAFGALVGLTVHPASFAQLAQNPTDARLVAMAAEVDRTLDGAAYALAPDEPADQDARLCHAEDLMRRMSDIPAVGPSGVLAKAKAWLDSDSYDVQGGGDLTESLCQDIERLFANGSLT